MTSSARKATSEALLELHEMWQDGCSQGSVHVIFEGLVL